VKAQDRESYQRPSESPVQRANQLHVRGHDASVELVASTITSCNYRVTLTIVTDIWCVRDTAAVFVSAMLAG